MDENEKQIHLIRAAFLKQFTETMRAHGIDANKYYGKVQLPITEPDGPDSLPPESLLPEKPFWRLMNLVAREENFPDFGAETAKGFHWHTVASLAPLISECKTLKELLVTFGNIAPTQSSRAQFELNQSDGNYWFVATGSTLLKRDVQVELYRVSCMIQLVQLATGSAWQPEEVRLTVPVMELTTACPLVSRSTVTFSCQNTAIEIPDIALKLPVSLTTPDSSIDLNKYDINANFIDSLRMILELYIAHGEYKIHTIAKAVDIPARTLQRRLKAHGTSFNELLGETRFKLAKIKLAKASLSSRNVAIELGYSDDAHFARAFKRWTGISPGEFRKKLAH